MGLLPKKLPGQLYQGQGEITSHVFEQAASVHFTCPGSILCQYSPDITNPEKWYWIVLRDRAYIDHPDYKGKLTIIENPQEMIESVEAFFDTLEDKPFGTEYSLELPQANDDPEWMK